MYDNAYNRHLLKMIRELDSKKVYDEPNLIFHDNVHNSPSVVVAGRNDMVGAGSFGKNGYALPDFKGGKKPKK